VTSLLIRVALLALTAAVMWRLRHALPRAALQLGWTVWLAETALTAWMSRPAPEPPFAARHVLPAFERVVSPLDWGATPTDQRTIAFVGDSFTYGYGIGGAHAFPVLVGEALPEVQVVNHGLPSQSFFDEVVSYAAITAPLDPDVVVWVWTLNDLGNPPFPPGLHPERDRPVPAGPWLVEIPRHALWSQRLSTFMQQGYPQAMLHPERSEAAEQMLGEISAELRARGGVLVVTAFPLLHELEAYPFDDVHAHLAAMAGRAGATWVDLVEPFRGMEAGALWVRADDHHPNEVAHQIAAKALVEALGRLTLPDAGPRDCARLPVLPDLREPSLRACADPTGRNLLDLATAMSVLPVVQEVHSPLGTDQMPLHFARVAVHRDPALANEAAALIMRVRGAR
jgi:lysophospholipase L1-like esterase